MVKFYSLVALFALAYIVLSDLFGVSMQSLLFAVKVQYMHKDSKLIADVPCFAELIWTGLWPV